jgi:HSP20 family molecular chaperone IbpA
VEGASEITGKRQRIPVKISKFDTGLLLEAEVPGSTLEDLSVVVFEDSVTIRRDNYFSTGPAERTVRLPEKVDPDKVEATVARGILSVKLAFKMGKSVAIVDAETD